jgi:O-methyltransferase domain
MLDHIDLVRLDRAVARLGSLTGADALSLVAPAAAAGFPAVFGHVGVLLFPDEIEDVAAFLRERGMKAGEPIGSVVVRERLAARYELSRERLPVRIITGRLPGGRRIEVFALPGPTDRDAPDGLAESERHPEAESRVAFELRGGDRASVDALRAELVERRGLVPDGGGYNPAEDAAAGGRSVFYYRAGALAQATGAAAEIHRLELACPGEHREPLAEHQRQTEEVANEHKDRLLELITAHWGARAVQAAAAIGLPEALARGARSAESIADGLGCDRSAIARLLRHLAGIGVVLERPAGRYANGPMSALLRRDNPFNDLAVLYGREFYAAWADFEHSLRTGRTAFARRFDQEHFDYMSDRPELRARFDRAMAASTTAIAERIHTAYDFSAARHVVDVGGGSGTLLQGILRRADQARAVLFDLPEVVEAVRAHLGSEERLTTAVGSFFDQVPAGADTYILSRILHDWPDEQCLGILAACRTAMDQGSRLLILERLLGDGSAPSPASVWDLQMLAVTGGRERTIRDYRGLLADAGFELVANRTVCLGFSLLISNPR